MTENEITAAEREKGLTLNEGYEGLS